MKTYYLIAEKLGNGYQVRVSDAPRGEVLKEFLAERYTEAVKMFSFSADGAGKTATCGVAPTGKAWAEII